MNRDPRHLAGLAGLVACLLAAVPGRTAPGADPAAIVTAEQQFAAKVRAVGVRDGFLEWLAPTAVVFRPGPVNGHATYEKQPAGWHGLLAWQPARAAISADGSLGWSTGPWTWRRDSTEKKADAHGEYMSVWRRQGDGSWKAVLDCGVGHGDPGPGARDVSYSAPVPGAHLGSRPLAARQSLYQADATYARLAASEGIAGALARYATDDVIVLREGALPFRGRATAHDSLAARETRARMTSNAQYVAGSGDMGYTYGTFVSGPEAAPDSAWYVHAWHRGAAATWRLAFEVVMPLPKPEKK